MGFSRGLPTSIVCLWYYQIITAGTTNDALEIQLLKSDRCTCSYGMLTAMAYSVDVLNYGLPLTTIL